MTETKACRSAPNAGRLKVFGTRGTVLLLAASVLAWGVAAPAEAQKRKLHEEEEAVDEFADIAPGEPMTIVVSVGQQKIDVYRGQVLLASSVVSTGMRGYATPPGVFSILEKRRWHRSNIYSGAPMPFMQRLTWSGMALHAGVVPGYPASHGCIRLVHAFAPKLFRMTEPGVNVVIARERPQPEPIEHSLLFQPPKPASTADIESRRADGSARFGADGPRAPLLLAKAEGEAEAEAGVAAAPGTTERRAKADPGGAQADIGSAPGGARDAIEVAPGNAQIDPTAAPGQAEPVAEAEETAEEVSIAVAESDASTPEEEQLATPEPGVKLPENGKDGPAKAERSNAPLRILVTKLGQREHIRNLQHQLAFLGFIKEMNFDGHMGKITASGIKAFQKAYGLPVTGAFSHELLQKVYWAAGKGEPPTAHLYVRQSHDKVFDAPVRLRNPDAPLGTYSFTAQSFKPGDEKVDWLVVNVQQPDGQSPAAALDRIEMDDAVRERIEELLTPGSVLILADTSINTPLLPKGGDYVVLAKETRIADAGDTAEAGPEPQPRRKVRRYQNPYQYYQRYRRYQPSFFDFF